MNEFLAWIAGLFWPAEKRERFLIYAENISELHKLLPAVGSKSEYRYPAGVIKAINATLCHPNVWEVNIEYAPYIPPDGIEMHGLRPYSKDVK
jgi:hypothetical protein